MIYVIAGKDEIALIKINEFRKWVRINRESFWEKEVYNKATPTKEAFSSRGYLLPISRERGSAKGPTILDNVPKHIFQIKNLQESKELKSFIEKKAAVERLKSEKREI